METTNKNKATILTTIKTWYAKNYPTDTMVEDINPETTFCELLNALITENDVYQIMGADDSIIRERLFQGLSDITGIDADIICDLWLDGRDVLRTNRINAA